MSQVERAKPNRTWPLIAITLALVSFALACVASFVSGAPNWPGLLLPLIILTNVFVGLEAGPFRSSRVRTWYYVLSMAVLIYITASVVSYMIGVWRRA